MPNSVELVRFRILRVREGVVLPSPEGFGGSNPVGESSEEGVGGEFGVLVSEKSKTRPRGRGLSIGPSSSSECGNGWLMLGN